MAVPSAGAEAGIVGRYEPIGAPERLPDDPDEILGAIADPVTRGELHPLYHRLREVAPVHRSAHPRFEDRWFVTGFDDALALYRNPAAVSDPSTAEHFNHGGLGGPFYQMMKQMMLFMEAEQHAQVRRIVTKAFTPRSIAKVRPITQQVADQLLDEAAERGEMDVPKELAYNLPIRVISHLMGVPESDFPVIQQYAWDFARGAELSVEMDDRARRADAAAIGFGEYFADLVRRRRADPGDDVLSALVEAEDEGHKLTEDQVISTSVLLLQAGHETTTDSIGSSLVALFRHPDELAALRDDPDLTKNAVEELIRYEPATQFNTRVLLEDTVIGDVPVPAGDVVMICVGAANRDPAQFPDPDRLQIQRPTPQHVGFAYGAYYCVGAALARTEVAVALRSMLDRFPGLRPATDTFVWRPTLQLRGPAELRVTW